MGPEINIDSILALEKQIEEGTGDVIRLKRTRNSLLNISMHVPPEILGYIFLRNVTPVDRFGGLQRGSYNFLLVVTTGSRSPLVLQHFGASGVTP